MFKSSKIAIAAKKIDKSNGKNVVTLMYWRKVIIVDYVNTIIV